MILRELREIDHQTDDILIYGNDGTTNQKIKTDNQGRLDIVNDNLDIALSTLKLILDNIDASTDELEIKTQSIRDQLDVVLSSRASEATSLAILDAIGQQSGTDILTELQNLTLDLNTSGLATEDTLIEVRNHLDTVETKLQIIIDRLDVDLSTRASETTSQSILTEIQNLPTEQILIEQHHEQICLLKKIFKELKIANVNWKCITGEKGKYIL